MSNLRPLGNHLVVEPIEQEEKTALGIILPETAKEKPQKGKVIAVGPGRRLDNGQRQPIDVKVGDKILFAKYGGTEVKVDDQEYLILREEDVLAVFEE
ncbi:MAG: co-chaperone GroES [Chloroflexi bacterium]|nr:co-chaperone GroES [Chloroflexota bacterium]